MNNKSNKTNSEIRILHFSYPKNVNFDTFLSVANTLLRAPPKYTFTRICMGKPFKREWVARIVFPQYSNFRRQLHPLLLRYTAEIKKLPNFNMFFEFLLKSFFYYCDSCQSEFKKTIESSAWRRTGLLIAKR